MFLKIEKIPWLISVPYPQHLVLDMQSKQTFGEIRMVIMIVCVWVGVCVAAASFPRNGKYYIEISQIKQNQRIQSKLNSRFA